MTATRVSQGPRAVSAARGPALQVVQTPTVRTTATTEAGRTAVEDLEPRPATGEALIRSLYEEHGRSVLAYATRLTGDRAAAEDVAQETFLRAWKHHEKLVEGQGSVRGW